MPVAPEQRLRIFHILRAPVGGLWRHVMDLARGQASRGHRVGIIADASTGGTHADATLSELAPQLALGVARLGMSRHVDLTDLTVIGEVSRLAAEGQADVLHGHGAKGGTYARLASHGRAIRAYTPHGGSLHYRWLSPVGFFYLAVERALIGRTDLLLFESAYGRDTFRAKIGEPTAIVRVIHNGIMPVEIAPVEPDAQASDLVFVGELRALKGVDLLLEAIALVRRDWRAVSATIVGEGPDEAVLRAKSAALALSETVRFVGALPARAAFALGRFLVVPSRAESLPYIVLEAAAATVPMIATNVGGIPEIFGTEATNLVPSDNPAALAQAIIAAVADPAVPRAAAWRLRMRVSALFSTDAMTDAVLAAYRDALAIRHG